MANEIIFYRTPDGGQRIEVVFHAENFWMTQKALAELFGVQRPEITKHFGNIFTTGERVEDSVSSILGHTTRPRPIEHKPCTQQVQRLAACRPFSRGLKRRRRSGHANVS